MRWIDENIDIEGKVVLVRAGLNVPVKNGVVVDDFRIQRALMTLRFLHERGARVVVIAHIGRDGESLAPVVTVLAQYLPVRLESAEQFSIDAVTSDEVVVRENLRQDSREIENDESLAQELAEGVDLFVQDAFSVCHREHTSIVGVPKLVPSYGGLLLKEEVATLTEVLDPEHPSLFILGGSKFETKEPLIRKFLDVYEMVCVGGALQNEILAARGFSVGASVIADGKVSSDILAHPTLAEVIDVVVERPDKTSVTVAVGAVAGDETIVDIGADTIRAWVKELAKYKTIVWNGPLGWYERGYDQATATLARALTEASALTVVGGGDTVAVIEQHSLQDGISFISTGGGAMLAFLEEGTLPGIKALS